MPYKAGDASYNREDVTCSTPTMCICCRPVGHLLCRICGHYMAGRKLTHCPEHPNVLHLMDLRVCPACKCQNSLSEMIMRQQKS